MKFQNFREIIAWQKARVLSNEIYSIFDKNKDFSFRDQIRRASVSVMSNIAEGYGRGTSKEFSRFLDIAKGSLYETQSLLEIAHDLRYIADDKHTELNQI